MTAPSPAQEEAERLLPCALGWPLAAHVCRDGKHDQDCPAHYRPAVAAALQAKQGEIDRLRIALNWCAGLDDETTDVIGITTARNMIKIITAKARTALNPTPASTGEQT